MIDVEATLKISKYPAWICGYLLCLLVCTITIPSTCQYDSQVKKMLCKGDMKHIEETLM